MAIWRHLHDIGTRAGWRPTVRAVLVAGIFGLSLLSMGHGRGAAMAGRAWGGVIPVPATGAPAAGPVLLLIPDSVAPRATLVAARPGLPAQILARDLPSQTALAPGPDGRSIALGEGGRGLWVIDIDRPRPRRVVMVPAARAHANPALAVEDVAWSPAPGHCMLAYALAVGTQEMIYEVNSDPRLGVWLVGCDGTHPRQLIAARRFGVLGGVPFGVGFPGLNALSWSPDGRRVLIVTGTGLIVVDATTGQARSLVRARSLALARGAQAEVPAAAYSPTSSGLFYLVDRGDIAEYDYTLVVADAQGHSARALLHSTDLLMSPVWTPDGRGIAYLWQRHVGVRVRVAPPLEVRVVDLATRRIRRVALPPSPLPLQDGTSGRVAMAWMPARPARSR
jgi:Tol biopolymer transport system component